MIIPQFVVLMNLDSREKERERQRAIGKCKISRGQRNRYEQLEGRNVNECDKDKRKQVARYRELREKKSRHIERKDKREREEKRKMSKRSGKRDGKNWRGEMQKNSV